MSFDQATRTPLKLGLIGDPVAHSRSPELHRGFLVEAGLSGDYLRYQIRTDQLAARLAALLAAGIDGLNVTIPHKETVLSLTELIEGSSEAVQAIGATNTLIPNARRTAFYAENTDWQGFLATLPVGLSAELREVLVIGVGGSARAIVYALQQHCPQLTRINLLVRRPGRAASYQEQYGKLISARLVSDLDDPQLAPQLIVNCSPVGLAGHGADSQLPLPERYLQIWPLARVYDLIYEPAQTPLLVAAARQSLPTLGGWAMLVAQARLSFEHWRAHQVG